MQGHPGSLPVAALAKRTSNQFKHVVVVPVPLDLWDLDLPREPQAVGGYEDDGLRLLLFCRDRSRTFTAGV